MGTSQVYFAHLLELLRTQSALKETALVLDEPEDTSTFTRVTTWILARLSAMNSYLWNIIKDIPIIQRIITLVRSSGDRGSGISKYIPGAGVGMCVAFALPGLPMLVIGATTGVAVQWALSRPGHTRDSFIGSLLFYWEVDRYKSMVGALIGLTEEEKDNLVSKIHSLTGSPETEDLTSFISSESHRRDLLRILFDYTEPSHM